MKKIAAVLIGLFLVQAYSHAAEKEVKSKINNVTVFLRGAQVNRTSSVNVDVGRTTLLFKGLTPHLNTNSLSVKIEGHVKVLSVNSRANFLDKSPKNPRIKVLSDSIELMGRQLEDIVTELNLLSDRERFVLNNFIVKGDQNLDPAALVKVSEFYNKELGTVRRAKVVQKRKFSKLQKLQNKYRNQLNAILSKGAEHTSVVEVLVEAVKATKFDCTLSFLVNEAGWVPSYDIRANNISQPLQIGYKATLFQNTGIDWKGVKMTFSNSNPYQNKTLPKLTPHYLRFISYQVYRNQRTNPGAKTAANYLGLNKTREVSGVVLDSKTGEPLLGAIVRVPNSSIGTLTDEDGYFKLELPANQRYVSVSYVGYQNQNVTFSSDYMTVLMAAQNNALKEVVVKANKREMDASYDDINGLAEAKVSTYKLAPVQRSSKSLQLMGTRGRADMKLKRARGDQGYNSTPLNLSQVVKPVSVEFTLDELYTVKSSGKPMIIEMKTETIKADFEYRAVPKLDEAAYLMAMIPDWTKYNLLEGEATLYFENTYIGKTALSLATLSDTLNVSFGKDKSIQIKRTKMKEYSGRKFIGSSNVDKREYKIEVKNTKSSAIKLVLYDQIPISNQQTIEVEVKETSDAKHDKKTGQLTWELDIKPSEKAERKLGYSVKYPKGTYINL